LTDFVSRLIECLTNLVPRLIECLMELVPCLDQSLPCLVEGFPGFGPGNGTEAARRGAVPSETLIDPVPCVAGGSPEFRTVPRHDPKDQQHQGDHEE
jgi:hypothetical protein